MRILVVDDDRVVAQLLQFLLSSYGYAVDIAADGEEALQLADAFEYHLVLLDVLLPGLSGIDVCRQLRKNGFRQPILLLTGQGETQQKASALNTGADDYVVKPFDNDELLARIQVLLRPEGTAGEPIPTWGHLSLDPNTRRVAYRDQLLVLTPKEYAILKLFLRHQETVFSAKAILNQAWASVESPGEEAIRCHIKDLRQKLMAVGAPKDLIKTVYRVGYRLNPLYAASTSVQVDQSLTAPQVAELRSINEELRAAMEQLQATQTELQQRNQELQAARDELEKQVADRTAELQFLYDQAPWGYHSLDAEGRIVQINETELRMFGYAREEMLGRNITDFFTPEGLQTFEENYPKFIQQGWVNGLEFTIIRKDGLLLPVSISGTAIKDEAGNFLMSRSMVVDIRDRHRTEAVLRESEEKYRSLFDLIDEGFCLNEELLRLALAGAQAGAWAWDLTTGQAHWSEENFRLHGLNPTDGEPSYDEWCENLVHPDDRERVQAYGEQVLEQRLSTINLEYRILHPQEGVRWMLGLGHVIRNEQGEPIRLDGINLDISGRKNAEIALGQREDQMSRILDNAGAVIGEFLVYADRTYVHGFYSVGCETVFGYSQAEMLGDSNLWLSRVLPEDVETVIMPGYEQIFAEKNFTIEYRFQDKTNTIRWISETLTSRWNEAAACWQVTTIAIDVSDRKQTTIALQQSEAKFRHFAENSHAVIWIADPTSLNCIYVSPAYEAIWGRSCQSLLDAPKSWLDAIHPDERAQVEAELRQKRQERTSSVEYRIVRPDGTIRWIQDRGFTVRDEKGQIYSYAGIAEDISDRKEAELTLQKQIQQEYLLNDIAQDIRRSLQLNDVLSSTVHRVRAFLEVDRVVIFRFRPDGQGDVIMESVENGQPSILSTTISDPCFRNHYIEPYRQGRIATMSDIDAADLEPCYVELLQQFQVKANLVAPILQNDNLWGLLIAHHCATPRPWQSAEIAAVQRLATQVGIAIQQSELYQQIQLELDDRKQAEQKIREQAALLDISTDAILVCDLDCRILYWNQGAEHLYGWQAEDVLGQKANELLSRNPSAFVEIKHTVLERGTWHGEVQRFTKTDKEVTVEGRCTLVRDEAGQPKSILSVDTDITEKKSLEAQFYQAQRLESLGTLTSGIAHDLNNTLTPILTIAQLLRMRPPELNARSQEMLQLLEDSAQRGADMVQQILTFTRGTGGKRSHVDVASLLREVVKVAQQTFPKFITICATVPAQGIRQVSADATQLHQVVMNLCVNARDAMPTGGTLTLSVENFDANEIFAQINLDAHVGQYVLITVADTGTGITPEVRDRIFDPFFTTKAIGQGTGLGLSTVLGIVRSYRGFIHVASEVGKGTQFKIYLPAVETEAASNLQETTLPQGHGELILVVDDESPILQSTRAILETHHYQVLTATNGTEAIAIYAQRQQDIAVVLVDIMMPDIDGVAVIRLLQEMNPQVRAIAVSGLLSQYQNSLESLGITTHLNKPYTTEDLLNSIHLQL